MLKNYLTIALRNLVKRKLYSFINIFGLAIGVAVCLVILKYVDFELSYDRFHEKAERIYRTNYENIQNGENRGTHSLSGYALGPSLIADIPEVESFVRTHPMYGGAVVSYKRPAGDPSTFHEENIQFVDSTFFDIFTYSAIEGNLKTSLMNPTSIVITEKTAKKYFHKDEDPLGKILTISGGWSDNDYEVTAVIRDVPPNSHFSFDFLVPTHNLLRNNQYTNDDGWGWQNFVTYVELGPKADLKKAEAKFPEFMQKYTKNDDPGSKTILHFQPILDIHLSPGQNLESAPTISVSTIYFFLIISIFILGIAWVNYINLSTARAMERAREVGIKKAIGAYKSQLMSQFVFESLLVNFLGVVIATLLATALLPVLAEIVGKQLSFDFGDSRLWLVLAALFFIGTFVSGGYPAFVLSSFKITEVLKGKSDQSAGGFSMRKVLVVFQFVSSLVLIAGTFAIYRQMVFMKNQDKGLIMDQMLIVNGPSVIGDQKTARTRLISLKNQFKNTPGVVSVTTSGAVPGGGYNWGSQFRKVGSQPEDRKRGSVVWVDPDFVETYGIKVLAGRSFNPEIKSDMEGVLVNEAALTAFGLGDPENALKEQLLMGGDSTAIIGVLKNYNWNSLKEDHSPWMFKADTIANRNFSLHLNTNNMNETIQQIEKQYKEAFPGNPFDYSFLDDTFNSQYKDEQQFARLFGFFSILAIIIACLGLWGLASFTTDLRLKEIGIRKVLGASTGNIMSLLSGQFMKLVLIASIIALPLTWYGIDAWLKSFAFRIGLGWDLFVIPALILGIIALTTVSFQILRGANTNPAKILRSE